MSLRICLRVWQGSRLQASLQYFLLITLQITKVAALKPSNLHKLEEGFVFAPLHSNASPKPIYESEMERWLFLATLYLHIREQL